MFCPFCRSEETKVIDSRLASEGYQVRRRRECLNCNERFTTFESAERNLPRVVKHDGRREPFNEEKLRKGIILACEKRPVATEHIDTAINLISRKALGVGEREIPAKIIGEWVMQELRTLDQVAYVRFASVYRHFEDINSFKDELNKLSDE
jgi:transcriptional repressor NrdR